MKFFQIEPGQRFYFKGEAFTKAGPLTGSHETSGEKKSFRRADAVQTEITEPGKKESGKGGDNHTERLKQEFDIFYAAIIASLKPVLGSLPVAERRGIIKRLDKHRERFVQIFPVDQ